MGGRGNTGSRGQGSELNWEKARKVGNADVESASLMGHSELEFSADYRYREVGGSYYIDRVYIQGRKASTSYGYDRVEKNGTRTLYKSLEGAINLRSSEEIEEKRAKLIRRRS